MLARSPLRIGSVYSLRCHLQREQGEEVITDVDTFYSHSYTSTSDVLRCGSGFKLHGVQVRHFHLKPLLQEAISSELFDSCIEGVGTLVSIHDQSSLSCKNPELWLK